MQCGISHKSERKIREFHIRFMFGELWHTNLPFWPIKRLLGLEVTPVWAVHHTLLIDNRLSLPTIFPLWLCQQKDNSYLQGKLKFIVLFSFPHKNVLRTINNVMYNYCMSIYLSIHQFKTIDCLQCLSWRSAYRLCVVFISLFCFPGTLQKGARKSLVMQHAAGAVKRQRCSMSWPISCRYPTASARTWTKPPSWD